MSRRAAVAAIMVIAGLCTGCATGPPPLVTGPAIPAAGRSLVYAALGASETAGVGLNDTALLERYSWPQLFFNTAFPRAATYYNFARPGDTTAAALQDQVPQALAVHPDVVTVFFNIDDLVNGVSAAAFAANLDTIVRTARRNGQARVLVANAPSIDNLPALRACYGAGDGSVRCPVPAGVAIPARDVVDAAVNAYDEAIATVVAREGATLVDLRAHSDELTSHPEDVAPDGLHPSALGDQMIAQLFTSAYRG